MAAPVGRGEASTENVPVLALIGKGITFDSGGISLKNPENMSRMKDDMSGAAAVLSAIEVIASRKLPLDVMAVIAAAENMPGPSAQRPGDVLVSADGKTVEVVNTDAEGRLVLADALTHALRLEPQPEADHRASWPKWRRHATLHRACRADGPGRDRLLAARPPERMTRPAR